MNLVRYLFHRKVTGDHGTMLQIFMTKYPTSLSAVIMKRKMEVRRVVDEVVDVVNGYDE